MRSMGRWGRLVVSASCSLVSSFSLTKSSLRAASHSWREVTAGRLIAYLLSGSSGPEGPLNYPTNATAADGQPAPPRGQSHFLHVREPQNQAKHYPPPRKAR